MLVKKFEAESIEAGLAQAKREMGPDALVLSTQQKKAKWFGKPRIEITVASAPKPEPQAAPESPLYDEKTLTSIFPHRKNGELARIEDDQEEEAAEEKPPVAGSSLRKTRLGRYLDVAGEPENRPQPPKARPVAGERSFEPVEAMLLDKGFSPASAKDLVRRLIFDYPKEDRRRPQQIRRLLARISAKSVQTVSPTLFETRKVWTALGTGGVGKTSLVVKLALSLKKRNFPVSLVGRDDRKIVAQRQLSSYAKLIDVPYSRDGGHGQQAKGVYLVDTPAFHVRSTPEEEAVLLDICRGTNTFVVLDASWRLSEMLRVVEASRRFAPAAVAFTRLDLAWEHGVVFDLLKETRLPLLGMSLSSSFKSPFKFYEPEELVSFLLREEPLG